MKFSGNYNSATKRRTQNFCSLIVLWSNSFLQKKNFERHVKRQLKFLEKDLLFDARQIVGAQAVDHADNKGYRLPNLPVDPDLTALGGREADEQFTRYQFLEEKRNEFAMLNEGNAGVYTDDVAIYPDNLIW